VAERPLVLVTTALDADRRRVLETDFELTFDPDRRTGVHGMICDGVFRADAEWIEAMPDLRIISCIGTGYDTIDLDACRARGVSVTNTAGANAGAVADLAMGLILSVTRGIGDGERLLRAGLWRGQKPGRFFGAPGLTGRRVGILGMGAIGRQIARRLGGFEVEIAYGGPRRKADLDWPHMSDLIDLATWADVLVVAHRADETNRGIVDARVLSALGPTGFIVNVSRGSAIDEDALIAALQDGVIAGAALDVFEAEPAVRPDLLAAEHTVLTPHIGGGSSRSFDLMFEAVGENLRAFFAGRPLPNPVLERTPFPRP
jgi:hydroxypyruvate reductase